MIYHIISFGKFTKTFQDLFWVIFLICTMVEKLDDKMYEEGLCSEPILMFIKYMFHFDQRQTLIINKCSSNFENEVRRLIGR